MLNRYIRGCENSTLANVVSPFCTALGVQTPLYCVCILYSIGVECCTETRSYSVQNCIAIHACFASQELWDAVRETLINPLDNQIDAIVYKIYDLNDEKIEKL